MEKNARRKEIIDYIGEDAAAFYSELVDDMLFIEEQLVTLKGYPFIKVHPEDPARQKATPAAKMYKELMQQYTNIIKTIEHVTPDSGKNKEESPLRTYLKTGEGL